jgi:hypothetical protein
VGGSGRDGGQRGGKQGAAEVHGSCPFEFESKIQSVARFAGWSNDALHHGA